MKQSDYKFAHTSRNLNSARLIIKEVLPFLTGVDSILDLGCGMGTWTKSLEELGFSNILMVDHPSLPVTDLVNENKGSFTGVDLESGFPPANHFDLIMCIEVLEHFHEKRAIDIFNYITKHTDLVLFSAAIPGQSGEGHINCRRHNYWHKQFAAQGFHFFDGFKTSILNDDSINYWLRQNMFIYYTDRQQFRFDGLQNITNNEFELVHNKILERKMGVWEYIKMAPKVFTRKQTCG